MNGAGYPQRASNMEFSEISVFAFKRIWNFIVHLGECT